MEPSITEIFYYVFLGLLTSPAQLIIILICLYYLIKSKATADSVLLMIGSFIILLSTILTQVGVLYAKTWGSNSYLSYSFVIQGISIVGSLLFAVGLFLLIRKVIKFKTQL